ncbi:MAG: hypothetical protein R3B60_00770 [Candidatus Paceibacterota bacterium]
MSSASEFGKDFGLIHEVVVTGRKAGAGQAEWAKLAHEDMWYKILPVLQGRAEVTIKSCLTAPTVITLSAVKKPKRLKHRNVYFYGMADKIFGGEDYEMPEAKERTLEWCDLNEPLADLDTDDRPGIISELGEAVVVNSVPLMDLIIGQLIDNAEDGSGDLHTDGKANIGYICNPENSKQVLYVNVFRIGGDWGVYVGPALACQWRDGYRVLSVTAT